MKTVDVKFDWQNPSIKENKGHNQSEWGVRRGNTIVITAYKTRWE